ncbi:hypothetical protein TWF281_000040 [Arthrobotrys megalospora]
MKFLPVIQYAILVGTAIFQTGAARVPQDPVHILSRQEPVSPFYPSTLEDLTLVRAAYDELAHQIQAKLYKPSPECIPMTTDKLEGTGSICPARDNILVDLMRVCFRQLSIRLPRLRNGITATPPNGVSQVTWKDFNDNYSKLDDAVTFALREIEKQACLILADTDTKTSDAVYGGTMTPVMIRGIRITVTSVQDSWVQTDNILEGGIAPEVFDSRAENTNEDVFTKIKNTRELFMALGKINDVESLTTGAQQCVNLLAELAAAILVGGIGGILTGSGGGGLPSAPSLPGTGK